VSAKSGIMGTFGMIPVCFRGGIMGIFDTVIHANDFFDMKPWADRVAYAFSSGRFCWDIIFGCNGYHTGKKFMFLFTDQQLAYLWDQFGLHGQSPEESLNLYQTIMLRPRRSFGGFVALGITVQSYYLSFKSRDLLAQKPYTCFSLEHFREDASKKKYFFNPDLRRDYEDYSALAGEDKYACLRILLQTFRKSLGILFQNWLYYFSREKYGSIGKFLIHYCHDDSGANCEMKALLR
jgi:hypothetical protein